MKVKIITLVALLCSSFSIKAATTPAQWEDFTDIGLYSLRGVSILIPAIEGDWQGIKQASYSLLTASAISALGKTFIKKERPDKSRNTSFPSNHTANVFAAATNIHLRYGWQYGAPAYVFASAVGAGRVHANKHYWEDVLAGALIGIGSSWYYTTAKNKDVEIHPWSKGSDVGISVAFRW